MVGITRSKVFFGETPKLLGSYKIAQLETLGKHRHFIAGSAEVGTITVKHSQRIGDPKPDDGVTFWLLMGLLDP